jgi:hypothetical protein
MHPVEHQRRPETATAWWWGIERHPGDRERLKALREAL